MLLPRVGKNYNDVMVVMYTLSIHRTSSKNLSRLEVFMKGKVLSSFHRIDLGMNMHI